MKEMIQSWRHVFKLDPDKEIDDETLDAVCLSGTDAIMVGGSTGVTYENTVDLLSRVRRYESPCVQEVSDLEAVVPGFDLYMVPMVLNTQDPTWIMGRHREGIERYGYMIPWDLVVTEGYIVLNENAAVAKLTGAETSIEASRRRLCPDCGQADESADCVFGIQRRLWGYGDRPYGSKIAG